MAQSEPLRTRVTLTAASNERNVSKHGSDWTDGPDPLLGVSPQLRLEVFSQSLKVYITIKNLHFNTSELKVLKFL